MSHEGLNEKGQKDYPKFTTEQIRTEECEICKAIQRVKKYKIIRRDKTTQQIYLCEKCSKVKVPLGVHLICLEKDKKFSDTKEEEIDDEVELDENEKDMGDTLLI